MSEEGKCLICDMMTGTQKELAELRRIEEPVETAYLFGFQHGFLSVTGNGYPRLCDRHGEQLAQYMLVVRRELERRLKETAPQTRTTTGPVN